MKLMLQIKWCHYSKGLMHSLGWRENMYVFSCSVVSNSLWHFNCSLPVPSVHRIFQARELDQGCHFLLQGIFLTQGSKPCLLCLLHCRQILYHWAIGEAHGEKILTKKIMLLREFPACLVAEAPFHSLPIIGAVHRAGHRMLAQHAFWDGAKTAEQGCLYSELSGGAEETSRPERGRRSWQGENYQQMASSCCIFSALAFLPLSDPCVTWSNFRRKSRNRQQN